jgi:ApaG protein
MTADYRAKAARRRRHRRLSPQSRKACQARATRAEGARELPPGLVEGRIEQASHEAVEHAGDASHHVDGFRAPPYHGRDATVPASRRASPMYKAVTRGIRVTVMPRYVEEESSPDESRYFFAYTVEITNMSTDRVQLRSRYWKIVDGRGNLQEVRGPGVVGKQPVLGPGETFSYTSGCPLTTPSGTMEGAYTMVTGAGESFQADIPAFSLDSPFGKRVMH